MNDKQARERAVRIGQKQEVIIYRFIMKDTIEEKIYHRQLFKQFMSHKILQNPEFREFFRKSDLKDLFEMPDEIRNPMKRKRPVKTILQRLIEKQKKVESENTPTAITYNIPVEKVRVSRKMRKRDRKFRRYYEKIKREFKTYENIQQGSKIRNTTLGVELEEKTNNKMEKMFIDKLFLGDEIGLTKVHHDVADYRVTTKEMENEMLQNANEIASKAIKKLLEGRNKYFTGEGESNIYIYIYIIRYYKRK